MASTPVSKVLGQSVKGLALPAREQIVTPRRGLLDNGETLSQEAILAILKGSSLMRGTTEGEFHELASSSRLRRFVRRQAIFREGDATECVYFLLSGRVKITQVSPSGEEVILAIRAPGEAIGDLTGAAVSQPVTALALGPCELLAWDSLYFSAVSNRFPALRRNAIAILAERLGAIEERFRELATEPVATRLARILVRLLDHVGRPWEGAIRIDLSREELAQMIGTTLFTVSRLLSDWESRGLIGASRQAVLVHNRQALMDLAEG